MLRPGPDDGGEAAVRSARRTLYGYAAERLVHRLRGLAELQQVVAYRESVERGYQLGPLFVEEHDSGRAMQALVEAVSAGQGAAVVAIPHRGHLVPLGRPHVWEWLLEELTGHPLVFTSHAP